MSRSVGIAIVAVLASPICAAPAQAASAESAESVDAAQSPTAYFERAAKSWAAGAREDATFWLYVAQLRFRARLAARPDLDPTGEPALYGSLMEMVGRPINEHAFGDIPEACRQIDRALRWDEDHPDPSIPDSVRRTTRAGLTKLRGDMLRNVDGIRRERAANGLSNR